jgi:hypothetical protein
MDFSQEEQVGEAGVILEDVGEDEVDVVVEEVILGVVPFNPLSS